MSKFTKKFADIYAIECLSLVSLPHELFFYNQHTFIKLGRVGMNALRIWNLRIKHLVAVGNFNHNYQLGKQGGTFKGSVHREGFG